MRVSENAYHASKYLTKKFNLQRYYNTPHAKDYGHVQDEEQKAEVQRLKNIPLTRRGGLTFGLPISIEFCIGVPYCI